MFTSRIIVKNTRIAVAMTTTMSSSACKASTLLVHHANRPITLSMLEQRRWKSASANEVPHRQRFFPVYVHHVSKIVLEHLQGRQGEWVQAQGLDTGLHINPNGTFVLSFPSTNKTQSTGKIWTSYDPVRKQHWLSVYRQNLAVRFLLKDHGQNKRKNNHDSRHTESLILNAVDQMVAAINQADHQGSRP